MELLLLWHDILSHVLAVASKQELSAVETSVVCSQTPFIAHEEAEACIIPVTGKRN